MDNYQMASLDVHNINDSSFRLQSNHFELEQQNFNQQNTFESCFNNNFQVKITFFYKTNMI